jgi:hypothetical protein
MTVSSRAAVRNRETRAEKRASGLVQTEAWLEREHVFFLDQIKESRGMNNRNEALRAIIASYAREPRP